MDSLSDLGTRLQSSLRRTLDSIPNGPQRPQELAKVLRVNKNLTSRLCAALRTQDPLATMSLVPGPVPLRQMLRAATAIGADRNEVKIATQAVQQFEAVINDELAAKQAVFRGMESVKGVSCDVSVVSFIVHPSATDPGRADALMLGAYFGLRRVRPDAAVKFTAQLGHSSAPNRTRLALLGEGSDAPLLRDFCRPQNLQVSRTERGNMVAYELTGRAIGRSAAVDVVLAECYPGFYSSLPRPNDGRIRHFDCTIEQPSKLLVMDLLIHDSLWPGASFDALIYDTTIKGMVDPNDADNAKDQFNLGESVQSLGMGAAQLRSSKLPRYVELHEHAMQRMGWDSGAFRALRCQIAYPVYGSQICLIHRSPGA
jgi:hypothetical protein